MIINGHKVATGTVISGTYNTRDLMKAFISEIKHLTTRTPGIVFEAETWLKGKTRYMDEYIQGGGISYDEAGAEIVNDLISTLSNMAPEGFYFGAHPDDGADFGWWDDESDELEEDDFL